MEVLSKVALVGMARHAPFPLDPAHPVDELLLHLEIAEPEQQFLLRAGLWQVYHLAGYSPANRSPSEAAAPPESLPACSHRVALLIHEMLGGTHAELLVTALDRLRRAGQRLPHAMLPRILDTSDRALRAALWHVVGSRGHWLANLNPDWSWVRELSSRTGDSLADLEQAWHDSDIEGRCHVLRRARGIDAPTARQWLEQVWSEEKAEHRLRLMRCVAHGLTLDDEPFLETCLTDRSALVKQEASRLLCLLPTSALAVRMRRLAASWLHSKSAAGPVSELQSRLAEEFDSAWARDGLLEKPPAQTGRRTWWLSQVMERVPPSCWQEQFDLTPTELLRAIEQDDAASVLRRAWTTSALAHQQSSWYEPLFQALCQELSGMRSNEVHDLTPWLEPLMQAMSPSVASTLLCSLLADRNLGHDRFPWPAILKSLSIPWTTSLSRAYLSTVRRALLSTVGSRIMTWLGTLPNAASAIAEECLDEALETWTLPHDPFNHLPFVKHELDRCSDLLRARKTLFEEIPSEQKVGHAEN